MDKFEKCTERKKQEFTSFTNEIMIDEKKQNYTNKQDLLDLKYIDEEQRSLLLGKKQQIIKRISQNYHILSREKFTKDLFKEDEYNDNTKEKILPTHNIILENMIFLNLYKNLTVCL